MTTPPILRARWASIPGVTFPADPTPLPEYTPPPLTAGAKGITTAEAQQILGLSTKGYTYTRLAKANIPCTKGIDGINYWDLRAVKNLADSRRHPGPEWCPREEAIANYRSANNVSLWNAARRGHLRTKKVRGRLYYHRADLALHFTPAQTPTTPPDTRDWLTTAAACAALGCPASTLTRRHRAGKLRRISTLTASNRKTYLYNPADIEKLKTRNS